MHDDAPVEEYVPARQFEQEVAAVLENNPDEQADLEKNPAWQLEHEGDPMEENCPALQSVHSPPLNEYFPAAQL
jgi:hypothetical protein